MVRKKKDWWKSGKPKEYSLKTHLDNQGHPDFPAYYYNPISKYTNTKKPKDFKPKYELQYPYELRDDEGIYATHESGTRKARFETLEQAKKAKRVGQSASKGFREDYTPYVIRKIKSKGRPKKKSNGITGGQAKGFFKRVNKSTSRTTRSIANKPKSMIKKPKSMIKKATRKMRRK